MSERQHIQAAVDLVGQVAVGNVFVDMRKSTDSDRDALAEGQVAEAAAGEERGSLLYVLVGSIRDRVGGAALLATGIVLPVAGSVLPTVS